MEETNIELINDIVEAANLISLVSLIALLIWQIGDIRLRKDAKVSLRLESIYDSYWLRTVIMPACITPLTEFSGTLSNLALTLPNDREENTEASTKWKNGMAEISSQGLQLCNRSALLNIFDNKLETAFISFVDKIEDDFAAFYTALRACPTGADESEIRRKAGRIIWEDTRELIYQILQSHASLNLHDVPARRRWLNWRREKIR